MVERGTTSPITTETITVDRDFNVTQSTPSQELDLMNGISTLTYVTNMIGSYVDPTILTMGMVGNVLALSVFLKFGNNHTALFFAALALSDFLLNVCYYSTWLVLLTQSMNMMFCRTVMYFRPFFSVCSPWFITSMAVEKYIAMRFPLKFKQIRTKSAVIKFIIAISFTVGLLMIPAPFLVSSDTINSCFLVSSTKWSFIYSCVVFCIHFIIPVSIYGTLNVPIIRAIKKSRKNVLQFSDI